MNKQVITIFKGKWYAEDTINLGTIGYDATYNYALDETLDSGLITVYRSTIADAIAPYTLCRIDTYIDDVIAEKEYWYILQDVVEKVNLISSKPYNHTLSLIEPIKVLERYLLPNNLTFTCTVGAKVYTIADVINRCLNTILPGVDKPFALQAGTWGSKTAPDFNFTNRNLLEALMEIGRYIGGIPILDMTGFEDAAAPYLIKYIMLNEDTIAATDNYLTTSNTTSPALYTDGLRSEVSNLVVKDEQASSYIWPSIATYGYARCALGEELTSSNMEIQLPEPVYHINQFNLRYDNSVSQISYLYQHTLGTPPYAEYHFVSLGDYITFENVPIIENTVYTVLPTQHSATDTDGSQLQLADVGKYQDTSIYFKSGERNLYIKGGYQYKNLFNFSSDVLTNILIAYLNSLPAPAPIIIDGKTYNCIGIVGKNRTKQPFSVIYNDIDSTPTSFTFNVSFVPIFSGVITTKKNANATAIPSNQQASIVDADAWGSNQNAVLNRTALPTITYNMRNGTYQVGDKLAEGYVMAEEKTYLPLSTTSAYTISRSYHRISTYTALDSRWRETSIPTDGIVNRTFAINEYLIIDNVNTPNNAYFAGIPTIYNMLYNKKSVSGYDTSIADIHTYDASGNDTHITLPVSSIAIGNSARFSFSFPTNVSAGNAITTDTVNGESKQFSQPIRYADDNGYSNRIEFSMYSTITSITDAALKRLPEGNANTTFAAPLITLPLTDWYKDSREVMSVNYQLHALSNAKCGFTSAFMTVFPYVVNLLGNDAFTLGFYSIAKPFNPNNTDITTYGTRKAFTPTITNTSGVISIAATAFSDSKAWVVVDSKSRVLMYSNAMTAGAFDTVYISCRREAW